ncbi:MAG TPA: energy transducer TonB, partial [Steroidobacteraceae bacterium]
MLDLQINERGEPTNITVTQPSGFPRLDESALDAARQWRFAPPTWDSKPVATRARVVLRYRYFTQEFSRLGEIEADQFPGAKAESRNLRPANREIAIRRLIQQLQSDSAPPDLPFAGALRPLTVAAKAWGPVSHA